MKPDAKWARMRREERTPEKPATGLNSIQKSEAASPPEESIQDVSAARLFQPTVEQWAGIQAILGSGASGVRALMVMAPGEITWSVGRFRYATGFKDVWLGGWYYDLKERHAARFCIQYLVEQKAFTAASARHFLDEIDPYVRKKGGLGARGKFSEIQIKQYFNDREGRLPMLRKGLIRAVAGSGKYYLSTGAA